MPKINVLILGKSGAGKSALLNLLWGSQVAKSAAGRPVTPKGDNNGCGIYPSPPINKNGLEIIIHDSWGMEADKASDWSELINDQIRENNTSSNVGDWFHTIIYCISAKGARIEKFEIDSIIHPLIKQGNSIVFALTKSDIASDEEYLALNDVIKKELPNAQVVKICSISQTLRNGDRIEAFGSEELSKAVMHNLRTNLIEKIQFNFLIHCTQLSKDWKLNVLRFYDKKSSLLKSRDSLHKEVAAHAEIEFKLITKSSMQWLVTAINDAQIIFNNFGISFAADEYINNHKKDSSNFINPIEWSGIENAVNMLLNNIPVVNFIYWTIAHQLHRDKLEEKIDVQVKNFNDQIKDSLKKIDKYLLQRLMIK